jgi:hypothetical protein
MEMSGENLAEAILASPTRLADLGKAIVIEAVRQDAPTGVVEGLIGPVRQSAEGARHLSRVDYIVRTLYGMRGPETRDAIEQALTNTLAGAPDAENRAHLESMITTLHNADRGTFPDVRDSSSDCLYCCGAF